MIYIFKTLWAIIGTVLKSILYTLWFIVTAKKPPKDILYFKRKIYQAWDRGYIKFYRNGFDYLLDRNEIINMREDWETEPSW